MKRGGNFLLLEEADGILFFKETFQTNDGVKVLLLH